MQPPPSHPRPGVLATPAALRRAGARALAERAVQRAAHLPEAERQLVLAVCQRGQKATEVAALTGRHPRAVRRQLVRLLRRVNTPEFALVVGHGEAWSATMRSVGQACFVRGLSLSAAAKSLSLTYHAVRRQRDAVCALARGMRAAGVAAGRISSPVSARREEAA